MSSDTEYYDIKNLKTFPKSPLGEKIKGLSSGHDVEWVPLVDFRRNGVSENTIHGAISWFSGDKTIHSFGGNVLCYGRSMMKPFYIKAFQKELANTTSWKQKTISISSHNGTAEHVSCAQSLLPKGEWGLMLTPLDLPLVQFGRQVRRPRRWLNNSSGHHAALLKGLRLKGINRAGYMLPNHELFKEYLKVMGKYLNQDGAIYKPRRVARDGDGLPTCAMTVDELAKCYAALTVDKDKDWIWEAFCKEPDLLGGFNRLDTTVIKSCKGKVIAKEGADGLLGLGIIHPDYPGGLGVVIKIAHGWNPQATWYVARAILGVLGFQLRNPYPLKRQKAFIVEGLVPPQYLKTLEKISTWDEWDPDHDRWYFEEDFL